MRIHAASGSAAVIRTLHALIEASGQKIADASDAELLLFDPLHPPETTLPSCARITLGQSDGLIAPFRPQQLLRLLSLRKPSAALDVGKGWQLDPLTRALTHTDAATATLTEKEAALLVALLQQPAGIGRDALLGQIWGMKADVDTHTLETHIYRLRQKLADLAPSPCDIAMEGGTYRIAR